MGARQVAAVAAAATGAGLLGGCAQDDDVVERSFTDRHGRVCTYVMVKEWDDGKDVGNISCEFPPATPSPPAVGPSPSPSASR